MSSSTIKLNLIRPDVDDDVQNTIVSLSDNFEKIDNAYDETILDVLTHLVTGTVYESGKKYWNKNPSVLSFAGWMNIRTGKFAPKWRSGVVYNIGDKVVANINNGHVYECVSSGMSAINQPTFSTIPDSTVQDLFSHTIWSRSYSYTKDDIVVASVGDKSYYYKCLSSGISGATEPTWINIAGSTIIDGGIQWIAYKTVVWKEVGTSCEFVKFGLVGDDKGADSIVKVGTITSGTWNGPSIGVQYGGTGATNSKSARQNLSATGKFTELIGDGTKKTFTITHGLGSQDVLVGVRESIIQGKFINAEVKIADDNNVVIDFSIAPSLNQYKVIIIG